MRRRSRAKFLTEQELHLQAYLFKFDRYSEEASRILPEGGWLKDVGRLYSRREFSEIESLRCSKKDKMKQQAEMIARELDADRRGVSNIPKQDSKTGQRTKTEMRISYLRFKARERHLTIKSRITPTGFSLV